MYPFTKISTRLGLPTPMSTDIPTSDSDDSWETKDDLEGLVKSMYNLDFKDPRVKSKFDQLAQAIWIEGLPTHVRSASK